MPDSVLPAGPWIGSQKWRQLLFAHYPGDYENLRELIPREFEIDRFDGEAWVGVVPFNKVAARSNISFVNWVTVG